MKEKQQRKLIRDAAEEVCVRLTVSLYQGLSDRELALSLKEPYRRWVELHDLDTD